MTTTEIPFEVGEIKIPARVPKQLNFDDVFGTNIGFSSEEDLQTDVENTPTDYENFVNMLKGCYFTNDLVERKGICQINDSGLGETFDVPTREIVLVESDGLRTVAMFCESDESLLGFLTESIK